MAIGNVAYLESLRVDVAGLLDQAEPPSYREWADGRCSSRSTARPPASLAVADPIKPTAREAVDALRGEGITVVMVTGDDRTTAEAVARAVGIDRVEADVLPERRRPKSCKRLQAEGQRVAMAGDGINDAPALAQADVGIAMGTGTDVAMESAAITLVKGDLRGIVRARRLSRATMRNIRQNLFFAFVYNVLGVPVAAGVLYPVFGLLLSPMIASAAMTFSSVSVIANALRLRRVALYIGLAGRFRVYDDDVRARHRGLARAGADWPFSGRGHVRADVCAGQPSSRHPSPSEASCHGHESSPQGVGVSAGSSRSCHESGDLPSAVIDAG